MRLRYKGTERERECIIEATIAPLKRYPRGWARSMETALIKPKLVDRLIEMGALRVMKNWRGVVVTATNGRF